MQTVLMRLADEDLRVYHYGPNRVGEPTARSRRHNAHQKKSLSVHVESNWKKRILITGTVWLSSKVYSKVGLGIRAEHAGLYPEAAISSYASISPPSSNLSIFCLQTDVLGNSFQRRWQTNCLQYGSWDYHIIATNYIDGYFMGQPSRIRSSRRVLITIHD